MKMPKELYDLSRGGQSFVVLHSFYSQTIKRIVYDNIQCKISTPEEFYYSVIEEIRSF
jgi:hypothetical protein